MSTHYHISYPMKCNITIHYVRKFVDQKKRPEAQSSTALLSSSRVLSPTSLAASFGVLLFGFALEA